MIMRPFNMIEFSTIFLDSIFHISKRRHYLHPLVVTAYYIIRNKSIRKKSPAPPGIFYVVIHVTASG